MKLPPCAKIRPVSLNPSLSLIGNRRFNQRKKMLKQKWVSRLWFNRFRGTKCLLRITHCCLEEKIYAPYRNRHIAKHPLIYACACGTDSCAVKICSSFITFTRASTCGLTYAIPLLCFERNYSFPFKAATISSKSSIAERKFSKISFANTSGSGKSSRSVRLLSFIQVMSKLVLSRCIISS